MIKIRLTALPAELDRAAAWLKDCPDIAVLLSSGKYPNRGDEYSRMYFEIEINDPAGTQPDWRAGQLVTPVANLVGQPVTN